MQYCIMNYNCRILHYENKIINCTFGYEYRYLESDWAALLRHY